MWYCLCILHMCLLAYIATYQSKKWNSVLPLRICSSLDVSFLCSFTHKHVMYIIYIKWYIFWYYRQFGFFVKAQNRREVFLKMKLGINVAYHILQVNINIWWVSKFNTFIGTCAVGLSHASIASTLT